MWLRYIVRGIIMAWKQSQLVHTTSARTAWDKEIPYSMMYPPNMTTEWLDSDTPENAQYEKDIKYTFNEYGFRSDPLQERKDINIMTLGCSMTVGVGVDQHENWTNVLKRKIQEWSGYEVSAWNFATSGASTDYVARMTFKVFSKIKPDALIVYWPPITRLELPTDYAGKITQGSIHMPLFPKRLVDEDYLMYNYHKNHSFLKAIFKLRKEGFYCNPLIETPIQHQMYDENPFAANTDGRDGVHPGPEWHERVAEYFFKEMLRDKERGLDKIKYALDNPNS